MKQNELQCPVFQKCGACRYLNEPYEEQLQRKQKKVRSLIGCFGPVNPIIGMEFPLHYRNKVHAAFGQEKNGKIICGMFREGTHQIIPSAGCLIEDVRASAIIQDIRKLAESFRIPVFNEDTGRGILRHVLIRTGHSSGQILVVLVVGTSRFPSRKNFVTALRKLHPEITTIVQDIHSAKNSMILGGRETVLYGRGFIEDTLCGLIFRISPASFYQVNSVQTEILYRNAIGMAELTGKEKVIDAYCGIGTIGMICARKAGEVIGIEQNPDAVLDARKNAARNRISNIRFVQADAGLCLQRMAQAKEHVDVLFMDPPRSGSTKEFLDAALKLKPDKIVYISCNPATQARDLKILVTRGYKMTAAQPVDQFVFTDHVETVCLLSNTKDLRRNSTT